MTRGFYSGMSLNAAKRFAAERFKQAGFETPALDARLLLMQAACLDHADLIARRDDVVPDEILGAFEALSARRLSGEPIDHILGYREFYGRRFEISKNVLSPRPETEGLIDLALQYYDAGSAVNCLDLGTGSGAIILTLLAERPYWRGVGCDLSQPALNMAETNAQALDLKTLDLKALDLETRVTWAHSAWFDAIENRFDLIVSNPPYIDTAHMANLSTEVSGYDPELALFGGEDGLDAYREIISDAPNYLKPKGRVILEIGYDQASAVMKLMRGHGFCDVQCHKDLAGLARIIEGILP